ncbi:MAG: alkaline phosphatase family protein [Candidatus Omnitrophica bacterium]|jgi:hypothetical protein|nr:alkaline phosphatase family protein [Candidatus Omnitrophota bacterium]MDD5079147.1 alkaline phosphatase family protein [Candidatus Omnitrophota bacterium]
MTIGSRNIKRTAVLLAVLLISGKFAFAGVQGQGRNTGDFTNIILVGWDGTNRDILTDFLRAGKLPNLKEIMRAGAMVNTEITTGRTETKPGWAEILTGYSSKTVGVLANRINYKPIPAGYTVFERLEDAFGDRGIITIFLAGKRQNLGARGRHRVWVTGPRKGWDREEVWAKGDFLPAEEMILSFEGEPYYTAKPRLDVYQNGLGNGEAVVKNTLKYIKKYAKSRFFMFTHFEEPDEQGHVFGGYSAEYGQALIKDDIWLGRIIAALKKLGIYEKTLIYVVTDHGFDIKGAKHRYEPHTFLITNDPKVKRNTGDRKDLAPTVLSRFGLDIDKIAPSLEGADLTR